MGKVIDEDDGLSETDKAYRDWFLSLSPEEQAKEIRVVEQHMREIMMSNDSISLVPEIDFESIEEGTVLVVNPDGNEADQMQVVVRKVNDILTGDLEYATAYLVESLDCAFPYQFLIGEGEIVSIVEEEDEGE